jgi:hypothetical protein
VEEPLAEYHVPIYFAKILWPLRRGEMVQRRDLHTVLKMSLVGPIFASCDYVGTKIAGILIASRKVHQEPLNLFPSETQCITYIGL